MHAHLLSCVQVSATSGTVACQALLPMGFPTQKSWSELPFHSPGGLLHTGTESASPALAAGMFTAEPPGKPSSKTPKLWFDCKVKEIPILKYYTKIFKKSQ